RQLADRGFDDDGMGGITAQEVGFSEGKPARRERRLGCVKQGGLARVSRTDQAAKRRIWNPVEGCDTSKIRNFEMSNLHAPPCSCTRAFTPGSMERTPQLAGTPMPAVGSKQSRTLKAPELVRH